VTSTGDPARDRAIALVHDELERLRAAGPDAVRALLAASPHDEEREDVILTTRVTAEDERLMVLVEAWRGRRTLATGGFAMAPDGTTHTPD
jgi:hypothetical protein